MGILYNRLLIMINEENQNSTYYHIAMIMLKNIETLGTIRIDELARICNVSKSTISKFIRVLGYEDYNEFKYAASFQDNKYNYSFNYVANVMQYMEQNSIDSFLEIVHNDISETLKNLNWKNIDRLVEDIYHFKNVATFGLMFSETAAMDLQVKLGYNKKFIVTNINDIKQEEYIANAKEDTLIIIFSDSGEYINQYKKIDDFTKKNIFSLTKAKIVVITSNSEIERDDRVCYSILFQKTQKLSTHRIVYGWLTDIIAYKYREYVKKQNITE